MHQTLRIAAVIVCPLALLGCATSGPQPAGLSFDVSQLSGWWAESYSTRPACDAKTLRVNYRFAADGKRLEIVFDRPWLTAQGMAKGTGAEILGATARTLTIRYDSETRGSPGSPPTAWELSMAAPGVYRWRPTDWDPRDVNEVVGIRCSD